MFIVAAGRCCTAKANLSEGPKELEGNRIRAADLNWPKQYSIPYDVMQKVCFTPSKNCLCITCYIHSHIYVNESLCGAQLVAGLNHSKATQRS